jgi:hypothetical protein
MTDASHHIQPRIPELIAEVVGMDLPTDDRALILEALKRLRAVSVQHRYGGMERDYMLAQSALEAWAKLHWAVDQETTWQETSDKALATPYQAK